MTSKTCVVIDYGIGNVFSVMRAIERLECRVELSSDPARILAADRVILPGVGAFGRAADKLKEMALDEVIHAYVATGKPFLGICVGMQLLMESGEEFGLHNGLGIIPGTVRRIEARDDLGGRCRVPLIGWVEVDEPSEGSWVGTPFAVTGPHSAFYFVHSFQAEVSDPACRIAYHRFGDAEITSAVRKDNVTGVQFHPERSARTGQRFLSAFLGND